MSRLTVQLFGPMRASVDGVPLARMRSRKAKWLLAALLLRRGRPIARDAVAGMLWPDASRDIALANLRPLVSELRRALGPLEEILETPDRRTIRLDPRWAHVDALEFDEAVRRGDREAAIELYTGPLMEDCTDEWILQERTVREQACLHALAQLGRAAMEAEDPASAADLARRGIAVAPWSDGPRRDLMEALAAAGDQNAALQSYREFVQWLRSERAATPDSKTTELYLRLRSAPGVRTAPVVGQGVRAETVSGYLPHPLSSLIGREDEQAEVREQLRRHRLVTLIGPGGIGKTRLAREVSASVVPDFPDGVWLVSLEAVTEGRHVLGHLAQTLGTREGKGQPLGVLLIEKLRSKQLLIVLDNCEHVLQDIAAIVEEVLARCGGVKILATSREAIGGAGERAWPVPALSTPDSAQLPPHTATRLRVAMAYESVRLFAERAQAAQPRFEVTGANVDAVIRICEQLQGVPLAIELAAARTKSMAVEAIAERLVHHHHLTFLVHPRQGAGSRRQTLRGTLDWSHMLLSPREQTLFRRLSVFAGGWTLEAAETVAQDAEIPEDWIFEGLGHLVDKSLVAFDSQTSDGRYSMLEIVRQYADEKLKEAEEAEAIGLRHREWCVALAQSVHPKLTGPDQARWLRILTHEMGNLRSAIESCTIDPIAAFHICDALMRFWNRQGYFEEACHLFERVMEREPNVEAAALAMALGNAAGMSIIRGDYESAQKWMAQAERLPQEEIGPKILARHLNHQGVLNLYLGRNREAKSFYEQSFALARQLDDPYFAAGVACNLGILAAQVGDFSEAKLRCLEAVDARRAGSDRHALAFALHALGNVETATGDFVAARSLLEESSAIFEELRDRDGLASNKHIFGNLEFGLGNYEAAMKWHEESRRDFRSIGNLSSVANALWGLGLAHLGLQEYESARRYIEESHHIHCSKDHSPGIARSEWALALAFSANAMWDAAGRAVLRSLLLQKGLGDKGGMVASLRILGEVEGAQERFVRAVRLWAVSERWRERIGAALPPYFADRLATAMDHALFRMGREAFVEAWNADAEADLDEFVDEALRARA